MGLKWTDTIDVAVALDEAYPTVDPRYVDFADLRHWVLALEEFDDRPEGCGAPVLEAILMAWLEERD